MQNNKSNLTDFNRIGAGQKFCKGAFSARLRLNFRLISILFVGMMLLAGCQSGPLKKFKLGDELASYNFSESGEFEEGAYEGVTLRVSDGVYRISLDRGDNELWWGQWGNTLSDVVIDVEATQTSERNENAFGIGCRMSGTTGQAVNISPEMAAIANGPNLAEATQEATEAATSEPTSEATIEATTESTAEASATSEATTEATESAEATEQVTDEATEAATEAVTEEATATRTPTREATAEATSEATAEATEVPGSVLSGEAANGDGYLFLIQGTGSFAIMRSRGRNLTPLVNWTPSDKIKAGMERNSLRAVCLGNYLAFYINGSFVGDATDDTFESGQVGLLASAATRLGAVIEFDDLTVTAALPG